MCLSAIHPVIRATAALTLFISNYPKTHTDTIHIHDIFFGAFGVQWGFALACWEEASGIVTHQLTLYVVTLCELECGCVCVRGPVVHFAIECVKRSVGISGEIGLVSLNCIHNLHFTEEENKLLPLQMTTMMSFMSKSMTMTITSMQMMMMMITITITIIRWQ